MEKKRIREAENIDFGKEDRIKNHIKARDNKIEEIYRDRDNEMLGRPRRNTVGNQVKEGGGSTSIYKERTKTGDEKTLPMKYNEI